MSPHKSVDLLVLGGGLTGTLMSLALARLGIPCCLIDKRSLHDDNTQDDRAITLTPGTVKFLQDIGVWPHLAEEAGMISDIYVLDDKAPRYLHLERDGAPSAMGHTITCSILKRKLADAVLANDLITAHGNCGYSEVVFNTDNTSSVKCTDGSVINSQLMILCDGIMSSLRQKHFPYLINKDYWQTAMVFNIKHQVPHQNTAIEHFMPGGPFAVLPLKDQYQSSIVWVEPAQLAAAYGKLPAEELYLFLRDKIGESLGECEIISKIQTFPLVAQLASNYYKHNMVLIGESAHVMHPLAGLGFNQTIKDIRALAECISNHLNLGLEVNNHSMLDKYQRARALENLKFLAALDLINLVFSNNLPGLSSLRKKGLGMLENLRPVKRWLIKLAGV